MNFKSKTPVIMRLKDFSVSKEVFELHYNKQYDMLETQPKPASSVLPKYYASEDYISHTDGKRTFFEKIYQFVRSIALSSKASLVASHANGKTVLDIGAGTGDFLSRMNTLGWYSEGYEPNGKATTIAISKGVKVHSDMELIENEYFEVITMWHVLEHVSNLNDQLNFINRRLTETGVIIVAVPNFKSFDAKFYKKYWAGYDVPRHLWHFSQKVLNYFLLKRDLKWYAQNQCGLMLFTLVCYLRNIKVENFLSLEVYVLVSFQICPHAYPESFLR